MKFEIPTLALGKPANVDCLLGLNPHPLERGKVRDAGDDQLAGILEPDEATVKQMVDAGSEQQAVLPIQPFLVR